MSYPFFEDNRFMPDVKQLTCNYVTFKEEKRIKVYLSNAGLFKHTESLHL